MQKPPIPTFIAAYPAPTKTNNNVLIIVVVVVIIALALYLDFKAWNKTVVNESH